MSAEDITLNKLEWYQKNNITLHLGKKVTEIQRGKKIVVSGDLQVPYDRLILATGSSPFILPLPGNDKKGVVTFRNLDDCQEMIHAAQTKKKAIVIGGGLLGLEAAHGLNKMGMETHVVHLMDRLMERQLDETAALMLKNEIEKQGIIIHLKKESSEILGNGHVEALRFNDGSELAADLIVMAVGIKPNIELAQSAGIYCERGILVNDTMQSYDGSIYALGECVQHRGKTYGLVAPLFEQGKVVANQLSEDGSQDYRGSVLSTRLKVSGIEVFSAGEFLEKPDCESLEYLDRGKQIYKKIILRDNKIVGSILFGDTIEGPNLFQKMIDEKDISSLRAAPQFFKNSDNTGTEHDQLSEMSDDTIICGCNGVSKKDLITAIREQGLFTREEVKQCTQASASCGGCSSLVDQFLVSIHGQDVETTRHKKTLCKCTSLSRAEIVKAIRKHKLLSVDECMENLEWENEGCPVCRPALNYFVKMTWPSQAFEDDSSRFVNERNHANIQKNSTYSVVPRMYAGITSPEELRKIADIAQKYKVKMVKLTGGQRIDLLGVKKTDLPKIWAELDMPSGAAYAKSVRTVKSCVGSKFCRFGVQNSIDMAIQIEKKFENLNTPAKVKMAVSGCPRNCAESGIKDVGVIGIEGAWDIFVGGNGGIKTIPALHFCTVKTSEEVLNITAAFLQYYREDAEYGERSFAWIERIGFNKIKKTILNDPENFKALVARMEESLAAVNDPWKEIVSQTVPQTPTPHFLSIEKIEVQA